MGAAMRFMVLSLVCGLMCTDAALAQQVINPLALAPAARAFLPKNKIIFASIPPLRSLKYARQTYPQRVPTRVEGLSPLLDWPWSI